MFFKLVAHDDVWLFYLGIPISSVSESQTT